MTFSRDSVRKIEAGKKTATTRVSGRYRIGGVYTINPYPAKNPKARFDKAVGYIRITEEPKEIHCGCDELFDIATQYYREEGFEDIGVCLYRFWKLGLFTAKILYFYRFKYVGKTDPRKRRKSR